MTDPVPPRPAALIRGRAAWLLGLLLLLCQSLTAPVAAVAAEQQWQIDPAPASLLSRDTGLGIKHRGTADGPLPGSDTNLALPATALYSRSAARRASPRPAHWKLTHLAAPPPQPHAARAPPHIA